MKLLNLSTEESEGKYIFSFNVISHLNSWQIFRRVQIQNSNFSLCKGESAKNEKEILKSFLKIWFVDLIHHLPQQNKSLALHCRKSYSQQVPCNSLNPPSTGVYACEILPLDSWKPFFCALRWTKCKGLTGSVKPVGQKSTCCKFWLNFAKILIWA